MGPVGDPQAVDAAAVVQDLLDLVPELLQVHHHSVPYDGQLARSHDAGRESVELERLAVHDDGVSGVVPALEAHDEVRLLVEVVCDLSFAFVPPLGSDDS